MDGVSILNQFEVITKTVFSRESFWWGVLIGAGIGLIFSIIFGLNEEDWHAFFTGLGVFSTLLGLFVGLLGDLFCSQNPLSMKHIMKYQSTKKLICKNLCISMKLSRQEDLFIPWEKSDENFI